VCKCVLLPPGDNPVAVNKYIISYRIISLTLSPAGRRELAVTATSVTVAQLNTEKLTKI